MEIKHFTPKPFQQIERLSSFFSIWAIKKQYPNIWALNNYFNLKRGGLQDPDHLKNVLEFCCPLKYWCLPIYFIGLKSSMGIFRKS